MKIDRRAILLALALAYLLTVRLAVLPARRETVRLAGDVTARERELGALLDLRIRYEEKKDELEAVLRDRDATSFLPVIEAKVKSLGLGSDLRSIISVGRELVTGVRAEGFDLRFEGLDLRQSVLLLEALQGEPGLHLDRVVLDRSRDGRSLAARVRVYTIRRPAAEPAASGRS